MKKLNYQKLHRLFYKHFKQTSNGELFVPGLVNLFGTMLHYVKGYIAYMPSNLGIMAVSGKRDDKTISYYDANILTTITFGFETTIEERDNTFVKVMKEIASQLNSEHHLKYGFNFILVNTVPKEINLDVDLSLTVLLAKMITAYNEIEISDIDLAKLCQVVHNKVFNVKLQVSNFLAIIISQKDIITLINTNNNKYSEVPVNFLNHDVGYLIYALNNPVKIENDYLDSDLNECEMLFSMLKKQKINDDKLEQVTDELLENVTTILDESQAARLKYLVNEVKRLKMLQKLNFDKPTFYSLLHQSNTELAAGFKVNTMSCNTIVYELIEEGCYAAREIIDQSGNLVLAFAHERNWKMISLKIKRITNQTSRLKLVAIKLESKSFSCTFRKD